MTESYPRRFGKYVLVAPFAKGGMGELHLAFSGHAELKKLCVIKTILSHLADEEFVTRFTDEAKVVVKLSHSNLVPVLEAGRAEGEIFLAMEYIDGKDLRDVWLRLSDDGRAFPIEVALFVVKEICRGLGYVHSFGDLHLVHRDVSPPNVLLSYTGEVRLTDFGVATSTIKLQKTAPGILLGKLSYMSPEQARNESVDARADLYSLGIIFWELLTGRRLFPPEGSQLDRYERAIDPTVEPPSKYNPEVPPALDLLTLRMLASDQHKRYADADAMRKDLTKLLAELAPAIDDSAVQSLLEELYEDEIKQEREERRELVDRMASRVKELVSKSAEMAAGAGAPGRGAKAETQPEVDPLRDELSAPYIAGGTLVGGRYKVERLIGEGGMGRVYLTTHADIGKQVAVKVLHPSYSRMPELVSRFRREARAASKIGHPGIVEVFDSGSTDDGSVYFVMEYLTGIDLADVLATEGELSIERTVKIGIQICEAVAAAHEQEIIHRDLKPENIYLTMREGTPDFVKVLDFGLAQSGAGEESRKERLTNPGMAMGTPEYMAPEQAAGKQVNHSADIYSVGTLLYEMLVGNPPHMGDNILEVFNRKATQPVVTPSDLRKGIPAELERLVMWTLEYEAEDRPQTMAQLAYELTKLASGRADAVASLLGIPAASRGNSRTSGPAIALQAPIRDDPMESTSVYHEDDYTAEVPPQQLEPRRSSGAHWWIIVAMLLLGAGVLGSALLLSRDRQTALDPGVDPDVIARRPHDAAGRAADHAVVVVAADAAVVVVAADAAVPDQAAAALDIGALPPSKRPVSKPGRRESQVARGRRHLRAGRFDEARAAFTAALRRRRGKHRALLGLAEVEFQLGRYAAAKQYAALAARKGGWRAKLVLANAHYKLRDYRQAVRLYESVLARRNNAEAKRNLAAAQKRLNQ